MARVGRLAGALLAETEGQYYLVGYTKEPCDFAAAGFESPIEPTAPVASMEEGSMEEMDGPKRPKLRLSVAGRVEIAPPWLELDMEGEALAGLLAERFLIERNGSVSERLWRLVAFQDEPSPGHSPGRSPGPAIDARWLARVPAEIWRIVRETVLRCT